MTSARRLARSALDGAGSLAGRAQVGAFLRRAGDAGVTVLDVDNTLADAWPSFALEWGSHAERLAALPPLPGMAEAAYEPARARGDAVLFLSHRAWWHWPVTVRWLRSEGFAAGPANVVLVASPADKVVHLERIVAGGRTVTYWDDLAHGHERGAPARYGEVIEAVRRLPLTHHGEDDIEAVVAAAGGRRPISPV